MQETNRIFGLDLLRSIAIILVLLTHTIPFLDPTDTYKISVFSGYFGVEFFFVLSGFLIGTILLKIYNHENGINFKSIKIFWIRRWFRTLPNYYLVFLVYAVLFYLSRHIIVFSHIRYLSYLFFLQNSTSYQPNEFFQLAWSLSIEEWFYLIFPLLLFFITRMFTKNRSTPFLITVFSIIAIELIARTLVAVFFNHPWDEGFRKMMPLRLDSIDIGVLAAYIKFHKPALFNGKANISGILGVVIFILLAWYFGTAYAKYFDTVTWDHAIQPRLFLETAFFTLVSISIALITPWLCKIKSPGKLVYKPVVFISKISYSIYLTHFFIILVISHISKNYAAIKHFDILIFISAWVFSILLSAIQYKYFEVKMTALRDSFSRKQIAIKV